MALRIKCKCGAALLVSSKQANQRLTCPSCQHPFRISEAKFREAAAKMAARRGAPPLPERPTTSEHPVSEEPAELDLAVPGPCSSPAAEHMVKQSANAGAEVVPNPATLLPGLEPLGAIPVSEPATQAAAPPTLTTVDYSDGKGPRRSRIRSTITDAIAGPKRGFWEDGFASFIYPVWSKGNVATLAILAVFAAAQPFLESVGCPGVLGSLLITGWFCALYFSVIQETAIGSDDLPGIRMEGGWIEDILKPFFQFVGAFAIVLAPATLLTIVGNAGGAPAFVLSLAPILAAVGVFALPVCLLLFAFNAPGMLLRPDLIVRTILRTFLSYLAIWFMLLLVGFVYVISLSPAILGKAGLGSLAFMVGSTALIFRAVIGVGQLYLMLAGMRIIGLYYLHFKNRFAIIME